jgi:hypothetical protein
MDLQKLSLQYGLSVDEIRQRWLTLRAAKWKAGEQGFRLFCKEAIRIRTKSGEMKPLVFNEAQEILHAAAEKQLAEEGWVRIAGLKGRREGFSTYVAARGYHRATLWDRQKIYILSHMMDSSDALFDMVDLMQEHHPFPPAVGKDNAKELEFVKRGSTYSVATAGQKAGGRGQSISFFHGSEAAWWTNAPDHFASSVQAVDEVKGRWGVIWRKPVHPLPFEASESDVLEGWIIAPSEIWLETTSAGPTGEFYKRYMDAMKGKGRYRAVFVPWTAESDYSSDGEFIPGQDPEEEGELSEGEYQRVYELTDGQMLWRRDKIHELGSVGKFRQEYPIDVTEAFAADSGPDTFIKPALILQARKRKMDTPDAPLIVGVDPAGTGGDRFAVAWRRGDKLVKIEWRSKLEHDEAVAWLAEIIDTDNPNRMCVDRGSMGQNIISSLRAQKKKYAEVVKGIDFGGKSKAKLANPNRAGPWNKRAEMYGKARDWLTEGGAIPDNDDLASDLAANKIKYRSNNDWLLKSKPELKSDGIRSPDLSDAFVLTFAVEEWFEDWSSPKEVDGYGSWNVSDDFMQHELAGSTNGWMA